MWDEEDGCTKFLSFRLGERTFSIGHLTRFTFVHPEDHEQEVECLAELRAAYNISSNDVVDLRLYFWPEDTPQGRSTRHGEVCVGTGECFGLRGCVWVCVGVCSVWCVCVCLCASVYVCECVCVCVCVCLDTSREECLRAGKQI